MLLICNVGLRLEYGLTTVSIIVCACSDLQLKTRTAIDVLSKHFNTTQSYCPCIFLKMFSYRIKLCQFRGSTVYEIEVILASQVLS